LTVKLNDILTKFGLINFDKLLFLIKKFKNFITLCMYFYWSRSRWHYMFRWQL